MAKLRIETLAKGDSNPGSLDCESGILPLNHRAPQGHKLNLRHSDHLAATDGCMVACIAMASCSTVFLIHCEGGVSNHRYFCT